MTNVQHTRPRRAEGRGVRRWRRYMFRLPPGCDQEFERAAAAAGYGYDAAAEFLVTSGLPLLRELASRGLSRPVPPAPDETA